MVQGDLLKFGKIGRLKKFLELLQHLNREDSDIAYKSALTIKLNFKPVIQEL